MAVEELLTALKIKRVSLVKGQKRFVSLHQRILLLPARYAGMRDLFFAVKWLGNAGSHSASGGRAAMSIDDVMDAYELMEHILEELYVAMCCTG